MASADLVLLLANVVYATSYVVTRIVLESVPPATLATVYGRLAFALDGYEGEPPRRVRVAPDRVVVRSAAVVLDEPHLLPLLGDRAVLPAAGAPGPVADLLDVPFASEVLRAEVVSEPVRRRRWAEVPGVRLAAERCGGAVPDAEVAEHDPLLLSGGVRARWWPGERADAVDRAAGASALGRALAWRLGRWDRRAAAAEALAEPADAADLRAEDAADAADA